jgi:hypothetical protein
LYARVAAWRQGKPTILRTINRYNDIIGPPNPHLTRAQEQLTATSPAGWRRWPTGPPWAVQGPRPGAISRTLPTEEPWDRRGSSYSTVGARDRLTACR